MNSSNEYPSVTSKLVPERSRMKFLPRHTGKEYLRFESTIYQMMRHFCKEYNGGYWDFYDLSNGGFYMAPSSESDFHIFVSGNGHEGRVSADAAGIIMTLFALNHLTCKTQSESLIDKYYSLREFADEHDEAVEIFSAID